MASAKFLIFAAASVCIAAMNFNVADAGCGDFVTSCRAPFEHSQGIFKGTCITDSGKWVVTSINLSLHIGNVNGNMVGGSGYDESCEGPGIIRSSSDFIVTARCKKFDGTLRETGFDVNRRISNNNGKLVFNNCRRRRSLLDTSFLQSSDHGGENKTEVTVSGMRNPNFTNRRLLA
ncbi:hypothetical protein Mapa_006462 [Marchantia paleacea]|nr:hypothetical protein Mapa_006462 [Marchantia paleacea]